MKFINQPTSTFFSKKKFLTRKSQSLRFFSPPSSFRNLTQFRSESKTKKDGYEENWLPPTEQELSNLMQAVYEHVKTPELPENNEFMKTISFLCSWSSFVQLLAQRQLFAHIKQWLTKILFTLNAIYCNKTYNTIYRRSAWHCSHLRMYLWSYNLRSVDWR